MSDDVRDQFLSMLPEVSKHDREFITALPEEFEIQAPYHRQTEKHLSGAAVVSMFRSFFEGIEVSQELIAHETGWNDWSKFNHETFKEDLIRYMAKRNYVPGIYYPGRYVLPKFKTGIEGADFIARNYELVNELGFAYFKATLVSTRAPIYARVHFSTEMYPMPEEMAHIIDTCGHAVLIVGYNRDGFLLHDPWDKERWGGTRGGPRSFVSYAELASMPSVNCCLGYMGSFAPLNAKFGYPRTALVPGANTNLEITLSLPGLKSITQDIYQVENIQVTLDRGYGWEVISDHKMVFAKGLIFGETQTGTYDLKLGANHGSYPISAKVVGSLRIPAFEWEIGALEEVVTISATASRRLDIKNVEWINKYGKN